MGFPDGAEVPTLITDGLLFKTDATIPPFARSIDAVLGTLGSFRWAAPLQTAMDSYVDTSFGPDPFVAIHWRRGYSDNVFTVRTAEEVHGATERQADTAGAARRWRARELLHRIQPIGRGGPAARGRSHEH